MDLQATIPKVLRLSKMMLLVHGIKRQSEKENESGEGVIEGISE